MRIYEHVITRLPESISTSWTPSRGQAWRRRARCGRGDFDYDLWMSALADDRTLALHICRSHCPVLADCADWAESLIVQERFTQVIGGVRYNKAGHVASNQRAANDCNLCGKVEYKIS